MRRLLRLGLALVMLGGILAAFSLHKGAHATSMVFTVTSAGGSGAAGTLRAAIVAANTNPGLDTIVFNITTGPAVKTISSLSAFPAITDPVTIDGSTQPGASCDPRNLLIEINGTSAGDSNGLTLAVGSDGSTIRGLAIRNFKNNGSGGNGILVLSNNNVIECNHIGTNASGDTAAGNEAIGVRVDAPATGTMIGGAAAASRNLVSGNMGGGILISGQSQSVIGNLVGTDITGLVALPNGSIASAGGGIHVNVGTGPNLIQDNTISGNIGPGMTVLGTGARILGNRIGVRSNGVGGLFNTVLVPGGPPNDGIFLNFASGNDIGDGTVAGRNVIAGASDVYATGGASNRILGNFLGIDASLAPLGTNIGVQLNPSSTNEIKGNVISGHVGGGILINGAAAPGAIGNRIFGNFFGTGPGGVGAIPSGSVGIELSDASDTVIGGIGLGEPNVITSNGAGVLIIDDASNAVPALRNSIRANSIRSNAAGLGIDLAMSLAGLGISPNDPNDPDAGPNNFQNFPILTAATSDTTTSTIVTGSLSSTSNTTFAVDYYRNAACDGTGNGEGEFYLGSNSVTTDGSGNATINATLLAPSPFGQVVTATATDPLGNTSEFSACSPPVILGAGPTSDLSLTKTVNNATPNVGANVTFTIVITNSGPDDATNVEVTDLLPPGLQFVSASPTLGTYTPGTGIWSIPLLFAPGGNGSTTATLVLVAKVISASPSTNTAEVTAADQGDPDSPHNNHVPSDDDQASVTVTPLVADLSLTKTVNNGSPLLGANVTFTVTVTNGGPNSATNVAVTDLLPAGLTFVSFTASQGSYVSATGLWTVGTILFPGSATLTITATAATVGAKTNVAEVSASDQADPDSTPGNGVPGEDDRATATVTPVPTIADLSLTKTVNSASPLLGTNVTFTVTVTNGGPASATNVAVADLLPAGLTFVSFTATQGSYLSGTGLWTVGTIPFPGSATLTITATAATVGAKTNVAEVSASDQADPDSTPGNGVPGEDDRATATVTPVPPTADLSLTKTVDNPTQAVGGTVVFTITLSNAGPNAAPDPVVHDLLPAGLSFVSATTSPGSRYNSATGDWHILSLGSGASATLTITATVTSQSPVTNVAEVTASGATDPDSTPNNHVPGEDDQASATVTPPKADLSLTKSVDSATPVLGANVTFTITVTNGGPASATNVTLTDLLPAGLTFVSTTASQGSYDPGSGLWFVGPISFPGSATLTITATAATLGAKTNTAQVTASDQSDPDSTPNNNVPGEDDQASTTVTPVQPTADLSLTKTVNNASPLVGSNVTFTISLTNAGPNTATNVAVTDLLPAGLTFVSITASQGSYDPGSGLWAVGPISFPGSATLTITATAATLGAKTNVAEVTASDQADPDSTPNNNVPGEDDQASATVTPVQPTADLSLTKTVNNASPLVGSNVTFTISLTNAGPNTATNVAVTDLLPAGLTFVSFTASQGSYVSGTGIWTVGTIPFAGSATLTITVTAATLGAKTNVAEVTASDQADSDSTPGNGVPGEDDQASATVTPVQPTADLSLTKTVDNPTPLLGTNVTFTVNIANAGPNNATNVAVTDLLPAGLTFVSFTASQGSYVSGTGIWTVGTIPFAGSATLTITATAATLGAKTNVAEVTASDQADPDSTPGNGVPGEDDRASATVNPVAQADVTVFKALKSKQGPGPFDVFVGTNVAYRLFVSNEFGTAAATNVEVRDLLPPQLQFVSFSTISGPPGIVYNPGTGVFIIPTLGAGQTFEFEIVGTVLQTGLFTNTLECFVDSGDDLRAIARYTSGPRCEPSSITLNGINGVDISVTKTVDDPTPSIGDVVIFTVTVHNAGPADATNVFLNDLPPAVLSPFAFTVSAGSVNFITGAWSIPSLPAGTSATLQFSVLVGFRGSATNTARFIGASQPDRSTLDDVASATVTVLEADVSLTKTVDKPLVEPGDIVTFSITVRDDGPGDAGFVTVRDTLPAGLTFLSAVVPAGTVFNTATFTWDIPNLRAGQSRTLFLQVRVDGRGTLTNLAEVIFAEAADPDSTPNNHLPSEDDQASASVSVFVLPFTPTVPPPSSPDIPRLKFRVWAVYVASDH